MLSLFVILTFPLNGDVDFSANKLTQVSVLPP